MAYDFLGLVNDINRRLNEVELTSSNFSSAAGFYAQGKDAVNSAIRHINQTEFEWPFNHVEEEETLAVNTSRYSFPHDAKTVNFNTFRIRGNSKIAKTASGTLDTNTITVNNNTHLEVGMAITGSGIPSNTSITAIDGTTITLSNNLTATLSSSSVVFDIGNDTQSLSIITYEEYLDKFVKQEYNSSIDKGLPRYVIQSPSLEFIISPKADKPYKLIYEYYRVPVDMTNATDVPYIPERFRHVIVDGAMYYAYMFRGNTQDASLSLQKFETGIKNMRSMLINRYYYVRSGMIVTNQGGINSTGAAFN